MTKPTIVEVHPGVCGFIARIEASSEDRRNVWLLIRSDRENIRRTVDAVVRFVP